MRFLIEIEHEATEEACLTAMETIRATGSHFLTNADWGCESGEHKCWAIVEVDSKRDARAILPPVYRQEAKIIKLIKYTPDKIEKSIESKQY